MTGQPRRDSPAGPLVTIRGATGRGGRLGAGGKRSFSPACGGLRGPAGRTWDAGVRLSRLFRSLEPLRLAPFHFDQTWVFDATPARLWEAFSRTGEFRRWWSWLRAFDGDGLVEGGRAYCVVRAPALYALRFSVEIRRVVPEQLVDAWVAGDLEGPARLEVASHPGGSTARLSWEVELRPPLLRAAARVTRPVMEWCHDWVVSNGIQEFRRRAL